LKLLQEISIFFSGERQLLDKDRIQLTQARTAALELAQESHLPQYDRFLAYLLGTTDIQSDYPLQAVRMVALTAKALQGEKLSLDQKQEVFTAALVADTGFRPAWLGHHGSHYEITAYQLKGLSLPWFTPGLERLILSHHSEKEDASPTRILSLIAQYLGMVYGTGIEEIGQPLVTPVKAIENLMAEFHPEKSGLRLLLRALSAFPLGSWVHLNSGAVGLVTGGGSKNPLRPKVSLYQDPTKNGSYWTEIDLDQKPTVHITGEVMPSDTQRELLNYPEILVPGWVPTGSESADSRLPPPAEAVNNAGAPPMEPGTLPSNVKNAEEYRRFVLKKNDQQVPADPMAHSPESPSPGSTEGGWKAADFPAVSSSSGSDHHLLKFYRQELVKLRATWEQQVRAAEQVSSSLKSPLIESYRRENELMSVMIERLEAIGAEATESTEAPQAQEAVEVPKPQGLPSPTMELTKLSAASNYSVQLASSPRAGLNQVQEYLNSLQDQVLGDQDQLIQLKEDFAGTLRHLESREFKALPSLIAFIRQWKETIQSTSLGLEDAEQQIRALAMEWKQLQEAVRSIGSGSKETLERSWREQLKEHLEQVLSSAQKAVGVQHHKLKIHGEMIERFRVEARQLAV